jgi:large subunit ribosomal protein L4e
LVVYSGQNVPLIKALRNIPGIEVVHVSRLNLLQLAPGGHVGRFVIWTEDAFKGLNQIFGTHKFAGQQKQGYVLPHHEVTNPDLGRVINSNEIQTAIRSQKKNNVLHTSQKRNPLSNTRQLDELNPNARIQREAARKANEEGRKRRQERITQKRGLSADEKKVVRERKANSQKWIKTLRSYVSQINQNAVDEDIALKKLERQI